MSHIGLDFGTTNSIISYLNSNGEPEAYSCPPPDGSKYIPSFIAYHHDNYIEIGTVAHTAGTQDPQVETYGHFKMRLPLDSSEFSQYFSCDRTPISVTTDYLRELLISLDNSYSFTSQKGEIKTLVVSVPEIWQRDIYNLGRERLQTLIKQELGLEKQLLQLVSEPVAAAAYYTWINQRHAQQKNQQPFNGNLLVCDMGGGTFDVSLCRIYGDHKVEVLYFDGQGDKGLESAGVAFDRRIVQQAYSKKQGQFLKESDAELMSLMGDFERVKINTHDRSTRLFINYLNLEEKHDKINDEVYKFSGYSVTFGEVEEAFKPIKQGIETVLSRVKFYLKEQDVKIDKLFMVGGFCQFILVQRAIMDALEIDKNDPRIDRSFNITNSAYAISYGACLIANGLVNPIEKYVHTVGVILETINTQTHELEKLDISLIKGGSNLEDLAQPNFYSQPLTPIDHKISITLWLQLLSKGKKHQHTLPDMIELPCCSSDTKYKIGMKVDRSQIAYLVLEELRSGNRLEYPLGNVVSEMFPGHVLIDGIQ